MKQQTFVGDFNNVAVIRDFTEDKNNVSFLNEIGLTAGWQLNEISRIEAGYNMMWVQNVARATDQLEFTDLATSGSDLRLHGGAFLHGANISLICEF